MRVKIDSTVALQIPLARLRVDAVAQTVKPKLFFGRHGRGKAPAVLCTLQRVDNALVETCVKGRRQLPAVPCVDKLFKVTPCVTSFEILKETIPAGLEERFASQLQRKGSQRIETLPPAALESVSWLIYRVSSSVPLSSYPQSSIAREN